MNPRTELAYVRSKGINLITLEQVWEMGAHEVGRHAARLASDGTDAVYLTVDIDVMDAAYAPGTGPLHYGRYESHVVVSRRGLLRT
jgi:arginase family enzyme